MKNEHKKILWNTIGSTVNALSSLVFLIIVTRINGINEAGIFSYSFATACLFLLSAFTLQEHFKQRIFKKIIVIVITYIIE